MNDLFDIFGAIFIIICGCLGHFIYEWSRHNRFVGYFAAVNESTWEHMKLILGPSFIWFIVEIHVYHGAPNLLFAKLLGMLMAISLIPVLFYTYRHFTKSSILPLDIVIFMLAAIAGQVVFHLLVSLPVDNLVLFHIGAIGLIFLFLYYVTHTYTPNRNFLARDPLTNEYGLKGHVHMHSHKHKHGESSHAHDGHSHDHDDHEHKK